MLTFLLYILKSGICLALFYLCFKALFSNDTFFRFNRWTLLTGIVICLLLPVIPLQTTEVTVIQQPVIQLERLVAGDPIPEEVFPVPIVTEDTLPVRQSMEIPWRKAILLLYLSGCVVCAGGTALAFHKMYRVIRKGTRVKQDDYTLVLTSEPIAPFSWGHYIILSEEDYRYYPDEILTHERMHLRYRHSRDLIFMEIIFLLHWFNPAMWLLKRELRDIHEYQADKGVLSQGIDATKYQLLLVKKAVSSSLYTLANSFNHSKIKKRITMMLKQKSKSWARLKLLLLVPVGFTAVCVFARPEMTEMNPPADHSPIVVHKGTISPQEMKVNGDTIIAYEGKETAKKGETQSYEQTDVVVTAKSKSSVSKSSKESQQKITGKIRFTEPVITYDTIVYHAPKTSKTTVQKKSSVSKSSKEPQQRIKGKSRFTPPPPVVRRDTSIVTDHAPEPSKATVQKK